MEVNAKLCQSPALKNNPGRSQPISVSNQNPCSCTAQKSKNTTGPGFQTINALVKCVNPLVEGLFFFFFFFFFLSNKFQSCWDGATASSVFTSSTLGKLRLKVSCPRTLYTVVVGFEPSGPLAPESDALPLCHRGS